MKRRRLRSMIWKQWKRGKQRYAQLRHLGISRDLAARTVGSPHGPRHLAHSPALSYALPITYFDSLGSPSPVLMAVCNPLNRRTRTRIYGGVAGADG